MTEASVPSVGLHTELWKALAANHGLKRDLTSAQTEIDRLQGEISGLQGKVARTQAERDVWRDLRVGRLTDAADRILGTLAEFRETIERPGVTDQRPGEGAS